MASFLYGKTAEKIVKQTFDYLVNVVTCGLSTSVHVPIKDNEFLDETGADDFVDGELSGTGYTGGFGGSGRKVLGSKTVVWDSGNSRVELDAADITWSAIDAGTIEHATLIKEITNDLASLCLVEVDLATQVTNGGDITIQWDAEGIVQLTV